VTGSFMPRGETELVDGGYMLSGKWGFASGCDNADWLYLGAKLATGTDAKATELAFMLVPSGDLRSLDNWNAIGLAGTGSHDVVVEQAFVPEHRVLPISWLENPPPATRDVSPLYRIPMLSAVQVALSVVAIGAAQGALDEFLEATRVRLTTGALMGAGNRMAEFQNVQIRVGEAMGLIDAALLLLRRDAAETMATVREGGEVSIEARIRNRRDHALTVKLAIQAVSGLFEVVGGGGLSTDSAFQRHWRDAHAAGKHVSLQWDVIGAMAGQHALGLEPQGHY
jgi:alkylation response protein AidB-like acyl-CoA dehydrogenase